MRTKYRSLLSLAAAFVLGAVVLPIGARATTSFVTISDPNGKDLAKVDSSGHLYVTSGGSPLTVDGQVQAATDNRPYQVVVSTSLSNRQQFGFNFPLPPVHWHLVVQTIAVEVHANYDRGVLLCQNSGASGDSLARRFEVAMPFSKVNDIHGRNELIVLANITAYAHWNDLSAISCFADMSSSENGDATATLTGYLVPD